MNANELRRRFDEMMAKVTDDELRIEIAKTIWNNQSDQFNQWSELGEDEKQEFIKNLVDENQNKD